jgi:hypothetical protein
LVVERVVVDVLVRLVEVERVVWLVRRIGLLWWVCWVVSLLLMLLAPCILIKEAAERATEVAMNSGVEGVVVEDWVASGDVVDVGVGGSVVWVLERR